MPEDAPNPAAWKPAKVPEGWTPFPSNPPPEKVGTRPQVRAHTHHKRSPGQPSWQHPDAHVSIFFARAGSIRGRDCQLTNELHIGCFDKDVERVRKALSTGSDIANKYRANAIDVGSSPLALACRRPANSEEEDGRIASIVRMLLDAGAALEGPDDEDSPLVLACITGGGKVAKAQTVQVLIDAGADLRARCRTMQMTPLHWAVTCGFASVVEALITAGASATSVSGRKPRQTALEIVEKHLHKLATNQYQARSFRGDEEKAHVREELTAIRQLVMRAADQRNEAKAAKKAAKKSGRGAQSDPVSVT